MESEISGHVALMRDDKCLLSDVPCLCVGSTETKNGHQFSDKRVFIYPDEVFSGKNGEGEEIFFIPVIPLNGTNKPEKVPVPIFMINFSPHHKREIITYGEIKGLKILMKHFFKPKISMTFEERQEYESVEID